MSDEIKEVRELVSNHFSQPTFLAHLEPQIKTMDKPVAIGVDVVGARILKMQNPHIPCRPEEIAMELIRSREAGATIGHIHVRDERCTATEEPSLNKEVWDLVYDHVDDMVSSSHIMYNRLKRGMEMFQGYIDPLVEWGPHYLQCAAVVTNEFCEPRGSISYLINDEELAELVTYLEGKGVKPELQIYSPPSIERIRHSLLGPEKKVKAPMWINLHLGKHHSVPVVQDPWSYITLASLYHYVKQEFADQEMTLGVYVGGRNWLPLTVFSIMLGCDVIRVGQEDCLYMYPHKDDLIETNASTVTKIVRICEELGRPVADMAQTRQILGLTKPATIQ